MSIKEYQKAYKQGIYSILIAATALLLASCATSSPVPSKLYIAKIYGSGYAKKTPEPEDYIATKSTLDLTGADTKSPISLVLGSSFPIDWEITLPSEVHLKEIIHGGDGAANSTATVNGIPYPAVKNDELRIKTYRSEYIDWRHTLPAMLGYEKASAILSERNGQVLDLNITNFEFDQPEFDPRHLDSKLTSTAKLPDIKIAEYIDGNLGIYTLDGQLVEPLDELPDPTVISIEGLDKVIYLTDIGFLKSDTYAGGEHPVRQPEIGDPYPGAKFPDKLPEIGDPCVGHFVGSALSDSGRTIAGAWIWGDLRHVCLYNTRNDKIRIIDIPDIIEPHSLFYNHNDKLFYILFSDSYYSFLSYREVDADSDGGPPRIYRPKTRNLARKLYILALDERGNIHNTYEIARDSIQIFKNYGTGYDDEYLAIAGASKSGIALSSYAKDKYYPRDFKIPARIYYFDFATQEVHLTYWRGMHAN